MRSALVLVGVVAVLPHCWSQTTRVVYGAHGAMPDPSDDGNSLDEHEEQQIDNAVESMASQFQAQLKQHITEQVKA